jgi:3'-phosphoadenosine 5'-phosphosulfate sulfotransferase (PAPS reductase)/FAD synthetase
MTHTALSLGAGVNSTALLILIEREGLQLDEVVFADTGSERPETYEYIKEWIQTIGQVS